MKLNKMPIRVKVGATAASSESDASIFFDNPTASPYWIKPSDMLCETFSLTILMIGPVRTKESVSTGRLRYQRLSSSRSALPAISESTTIMPDTGSGGSVSGEMRPSGPGATPKTTKNKKMKMVPQLNSGCDPANKP